MGSIEIGQSTEDSLGYDFEDKQTRLQLELMDDLQKLGVERYLDLPQLVVVGDQSTGKSSVLQAVTEIPFPIDDKMCTRFATEIILQRTSEKETTIKIQIIPSVDESPERKEALENWQPDGFDRTATLNNTTVDNVFSQAEKIIFEGSGKQVSRTHGRRNNRLSSSTLRITRSGPKETNFAIVDVPGLVRGKETSEEHRTARSLVSKYLNNTRSIVVVVIDIVDLERQDIFHMLNDLPDVKSRVIGVINKCDTKQDQSHDFVYNLINNNPSTSEYYLKEGWYGLRNRTPAERSISISDSERDELEQTFFTNGDWTSLEATRLGRHNLKKALISMRNLHVKRSIPDLLSEVQVKLDRCKVRLDTLGEPRISNESQIRLINRIANTYSELSKAALDGHYEVLADQSLFARRLIRQELLAFKDDMDKGGLKIPFRSDQQDADAIAGCNQRTWSEILLKTESYGWLRKAINIYRAKEDPDEVNPFVKSTLWKEQMSSWDGISKAALERIRQMVDDLNMALFETACPDKQVRTKLQLWLQESFSKATDNARIELQRLINDELNASLTTLSPGRDVRKQNFRQARINAITRKLKQSNPETALPQNAGPDVKVNNISAEVVINSIICENAELSGVLNAHDSLAAYYSVALYRFIDNFALQVVERHLLGPEGPLRLFNSDYVLQNLIGEAHVGVLNGLAGEDPTVSKERSELEIEKVSLEECKKRVQSFTIS